MLKGRVLSSLSDVFVKRRLWSDAEPICVETIGVLSRSFEGQDEALHSNLGIQHYQLSVVKRNLKKLEEALENAVKAYEHVIQSKLKMEFSSSIARQRADILDAMGRFEDAKTVMLDHVERLKAMEATAKQQREQQLALKSGDEEDDDNAAESPAAPPAPAPTNMADNLLFLARLNFEHAHYTDAIELLKNAFALVPSPYYLSMLASAQFEAGLNDEAVATQAQLKKLRPGQEMPICTSQLFITKLHYLRQTKLDGKWVFHIEVENKPLVPMGTELRLKAGALVECFVRRHADPDEPIGALSTASLASTSTSNPITQGPYTYVLKGDEKDNAIKIRGLIPSTAKIEPSAYYEIVLHCYASPQDKAHKVGTHRQLVKATAFNAIAFQRLLGESPLTAADLGEDDEDLEDYALPEPTEVIEDMEEEVAEIHADEVAADVVEVEADETLVVSLPKENADSVKEKEVQEEAVEAQKEEQKIHDEIQLAKQEVEEDEKLAAEPEAAPVEALKEAEAVVEEAKQVEEAPKQSESVAEVAEEVAKVVENAVEEVAVEETQEKEESNTEAVAVVEEEAPVQPKEEAVEEQVVVVVVEDEKPEIAAEEVVAEESAPTEEEKAVVSEENAQDADVAVSEEAQE